MATTALPSAGTTSTQGLSDWAAPYITNYLGQAQTLGGQDYQTYQGPLTAGPSDIQSNVFSGIGNLSVPSILGQNFTSAGTPTAGLNASGTATTGAGGVASSYMNPYLQNVLDPQLAELRRQNDITNMNANAKLTGAGAYGGGRQAIMNAENNRNLMTEMNKTVGAGYANAYDKAMQQFNTEQGRGMDLTKLMSDIGAQQRGITSEGVAADKAEFEAQRQYPYQQVQFMRDMISGLPTQSISSSANAPTGIAALATAAGGLDKLLNLSTSDQSGGLAKLLNNLGLNLGG